MQEIERKFLVRNDDYKSQAVRHYDIKQGYLSSVPERTVRIRIKGEKGYITIKGKSNETGLSRYEWEKEISVSEAKELLELCEPHIIEKVRYEIEFSGHLFEVDEFEDLNKGLTLAEIELQSEDEDFLRPDWLGKEVTGNEKYYNAFLSKNPLIISNSNL